MHEQTEHHEHRAEPGAPTGTDPVCGMKVPLSSPHRHAVNGSEVVFCSTRCRDRFASDPSKYLSREHHEPPSAPSGSKGAYTCPMHPEVRVDQPGCCPKCGMAFDDDARGDRSAEDIEGSARLILQPKDPAQLGALREHVRIKAQRMAGGECPMMSLSSGGEPAAGEKPAATPTGNGKARP